MAKPYVQVTKIGASFQLNKSYKENKFSFHVFIGGNYINFSHIFVIFSGLVTDGTIQLCHRIGNIFCYLFILNSL